MKFLFLCALALLSLETHALSIQSFRFSDSYRYSITDDSYQEKFRSRYIVTSGLGFINSPFYVSDKDVTTVDSEIINHQYILNLGATYYYNNELAIGADITGNHSEVFGDTYTTLGDTVLKARYNLYRENSLSFAVNPKIYLPTGDEDNFSTTESVGLSLSGVGEYKLNEWHFLASLGFFHAGENNYAIVDYRNLILTTFAASYDLTSDWTINAEAVKNFTTDRDYRQDEGDYYVTFKYKANQMFGLFFGAGTAGVNEIDRNNYTLFTGIKIHNF